MGHQCALSKDDREFTKQKWGEKIFKAKKMALTFSHLSIHFLHQIVMAGSSRSSGIMMNLKCPHFDKGPYRIYHLYYEAPLMGRIISIRLRIACLQIVFSFSQVNKLSKLVNQVNL